MVMKLKPPKEVVETVDANWGEGLEEKEFVLQGELDEPCDDPKKVPDGDDDEYEPSIAGDEIVADFSKEPKNVPVNAGDEPLDPDAQLHKEVEKLSAPLKVRHVTLMEPVMSRGVQHVFACHGSNHDPNEIQGCLGEQNPFRPGERTVVLKISVLGCPPKRHAVLHSGR